MPHDTPVSPHGRLVFAADATLADCALVAHLTVEEQLYARAFPWSLLPVYRRLAILEGAYTVRVCLQ